MIRYGSKVVTIASRVVRPVSGEGGGEGGDSPQYNPERKSGEARTQLLFKLPYKYKQYVPIVSFLGVFFFCLSNLLSVGATPHVLLMVVIIDAAVSITRVILHVF